MRTAALFALAGSIALLAACASTDRNGDAPLRAVERVSAVEGHWTLVAIDGRPVENLEAIGVRRPPHMVIADDGAAAGFAGVNRYSTRLVLGPAGASFAPAIATKMAGQPEANALEMRFLRAIDRVDGVRASADRLVFLAGDAEALAFVRAE